MAWRWVGCDPWSRIYSRSSKGWDQVVYDVSDAPPAVISVRPSLHQRRDGASHHGVYDMALWRR